MRDTLLRQLAMLRLIPRAPRKRDPASIQRLLADQGYDVDIRSIQRDLNKLQGTFPLICDDRSKPYGWSFMRNAEVIELPSMDVQTALTLKLVREYLESLLPRTTLEFLAPHMRRADEVLAKTSSTALARWPEQVRVIPTGQTLLPPKLDARVLTVVYMATLRGRRLQIHYRKSGADELREYEVNPLGLVVRDSVIYLVGSMWHYDNATQLALHRMVGAEELDKARRTPPGFDLDSYIGAGSFGYRLSEQDVTLRARIKKPVARILEETPLSTDQNLEEEDEWALLEATVPLTKHLRGWILRYGSMIEVLEPAALREDIRREVEALGQLYEGRQ